MVLKLFSLFSGYGGAEFALKKASIDFECVGYSEIDKFAIQCYNQNHGNIKNFGDVTKIDEKQLPDFDLLTGGFPCQTFSIAGKRQGFKDNTKGTLFFDIIRIVDYKKPKYLLLENVEGLLNHNNGRTLHIILGSLREIGYDVIMYKLNSKHYGIPQSRGRVWFLCNRDGWEFGQVYPPQKEKLEITVKNLLEDEVNKKYYLKQSQINNINKHIKFQKIKGNNFGNFPLDINKESTCLTATNGLIENTIPYFKIADYRNDEGLRIRKDNNSPSLNASHNSESELSRMSPIVHCTQKRSVDKPSIKKNYKSGGSGHIFKTDGTTYCVDTGNTQVIEMYQYGHTNMKGKREFNEGIEPTLPAETPRVAHKINNSWRRLTPTECFRLMGFLDDEINIDNISDSQLYKLAGNGWEINIASKIFKVMLCE